MFGGCPKRCCKIVEFAATKLQRKHPEDKGNIPNMANQVRIPPRNLRF